MRTFPLVGEYLVWSARERAFGAGAGGSLRCIGCILCTTNLPVCVSVALEGAHACAESTGAAPSRFSHSTVVTPRSFSLQRVTDPCKGRRYEGEFEGLLYRHHVDRVATD